MLGRRRIAPVQDAWPEGGGSAGGAGGAGDASRADGKEVDPAYVSPFGGRKVFLGGTRELDSDEVTPYTCRTLNPKPQNLNLKPQSLNLKPQTHNLRPNPLTLKPKPYTL